MDDCTIVSRMLAGMVAGVLLLSPAAADAADLTVPAACFASGQRLTLSGTSFTPGTPIAIAGDVTGAAQADPAGTFSTAITAPPVAELGPRVVTVSAVDQTNPANVATLRLRVAHDAFGPNRPGAGRPRELATWRVGGLRPRQALHRP